MVSYRPATKAPKLQQKGISPLNESPAAVPTMLDSAIPIWKKRLGNSFANKTLFVLTERSASSTTIFENSLPRSLIASPKESRVALSFDIVGAVGALIVWLPL